jgi:hypothetical protein
MRFEVLTAMNILNCLLDYDVMWPCNWLPRFARDHASNFYRCENLKSRCLSQKFNIFQGGDLLRVRMFIPSFVKTAN